MKNAQNYNHSVQVMLKQKLLKKKKHLKPYTFGTLVTVPNQWQAKLQVFMSMWVMQYEIINAYVW